MNAKFPLGRTVVTPNALAHLTCDDLLAGFECHQSGDWGDMPESDRQENEMSLQQGFRLLSAYRAANGVKFWIVTEADRNVTTVLLPEDY